MKLEFSRKFLLTVGIRNFAKTPKTISITSFCNIRNHLPVQSAYLMLLVTLHGQARWQCVGIQNVRERRHKK
jgi:hypothetical protein